MACQQLEVLTYAVEKLPIRCREVLVLRKVENLRAAAIVLRLGIGPRAVEKHLRRALLHCWATLGERDGALISSPEASLSGPPEVSPGALPSATCNAYVKIAHGVREHAADWAVRVDACECSEMEWRELERWLTDDTTHRAAFEQACVLWVELDDVAREVDWRAAAGRRPRLARRQGMPRLEIAAWRWFGLLNGAFFRRRG